MPINWQISVLSSTPSTQDIILGLIKDGSGEEGTAVQAMSQPHGRGRHGKVWDGPIGNLYISFLLSPSCPLQKIGEIGFVIAIALSRLLDHYIETTKHKKSLKWPNDILVDGKKISGILIESSLEGTEVKGLAVGIGLNIFTPPAFSISLNNIAKEPVYIHQVRDRLLQEISAAYEQWINTGFTPIREEWLRQAQGIGQEITARLPHISYTGIFQGLTEDGSLILLMNDGTQKTVTAAEIFFGKE